MPGLLNASIPFSHLCPKKVLHSSEPTSPPLTLALPVPPPSSHLPSATWTTAVHPQLQSPARPLVPQLAKSQRQSLTAHSDPLWLKTQRAR